MARKRISRRKFVGDLGAAAAFTIVPRHVLGRGYRAPSDTVTVACIGVGGMGANDVKGVAKAGANIYALCDVDEHQAAQSFAAFPKAKRFKDFRVLLEKEAKNIDAVTVSTPDHVHAVAGMMAMKMGKHTRIQKPLARTLWEVRQLMETARKSKVATQMGNQGHAGEGTRQIREWVEAGVIGTVREVQLWTNRPIWPQALDRPLEEYYTPPWIDWDLWLGPAPARPYNPAYAPFKWRGWWDFGTGALGDIACHSMDASFWTLGLGYPTRIEPESTKLYGETAPACSRITYTFAAKGNRPEVKVVWHDGSLYPPRPKEVTDPALWPFDTSGQLWIGDQGKLVAGIYGEDPRLLDEARQAEITAHPPAQKYPRLESVYAEFLTACKGGTPAGSNFPDHAGPLTEMVLLGNLALRTDQVLEIDSHTGEVANTKVPAEYVRSEYRAGWTV
jgi:predicted dehydrogenase